MDDSNPFFRLARCNPHLDRQIVCDAIGASCARGGDWDSLYAARRGAYKAAGVVMSGDPFDGATFAEFLGIELWSGGESSGENGLVDTRDAAHDFLEELRLCKSTP